jgi:hypothetical protein
MVVYFVLCVGLATGAPVWARLSGTGWMRSWVMGGCCLAAIVCLWAALRELSSLQTTDRTGTGIFSNGAVGKTIVRLSERRLTLHNRIAAGPQALYGDASLLCSIAVRQFVIRHL